MRRAALDGVLRAHVQSRRAPHPLAPVGVVGELEEDRCERPPGDATSSGSFIAASSGMSP